MSLLSSRPSVWVSVLCGCRGPLCWFVTHGYVFMRVVRHPWFWGDPWQSSSWGLALHGLGLWPLGVHSLSAFWAPDLAVSPDFCLPGLVIFGSLMTSSCFLSSWDSKLNFPGHRSHTSGRQQKKNDGTCVCLTRSPVCLLRTCMC